MGILRCKSCFNTAEAKTKEDAIALIDHAGRSKKCTGADDLCEWFPQGIPEIKPDGFVDPKRPIQGITIPSRPAKSGK